MSFEIYSTPTPYGIDVYLRTKFTQALPKNLTRHTFECLKQ